MLPDVITGVPTLSVFTCVCEVVLPEVVTGEPIETVAVWLCPEAPELATTFPPWAFVEFHPVE